MLQIFYLLTEVSCYEHLGLADQKGPVTREGAVESKFSLEKSHHRRGEKMHNTMALVYFLFFYYFFHVAS